MTEDKKAEEIKRLKSEIKSWEDDLKEIEKKLSNGGSVEQMRNLIKTYDYTLEMITNRKSYLLFVFGIEE